MSRRVALAICALTMACGPVFDSGDAKLSRSAIVGGILDLADLQVFELKIAGLPTGSGNCSATLIGARTLLTAAHCVDPRRFGASSLVILATNKTDSATATAADFIKVVETRFHPAWTSLSVDNDIAVALLEKEPGVAPKAWNAVSVTSFGGKPLRVVGYGMTGPADGGEGIKREVNLTFRQLTASQILIGDQASKGICSGDSGGPSFHLFSDGVERVVGVHSTSSLAESCLDGTDQRVDFHAAFIRGWLMEKEPPACWDDGRCVAVGCASVDLDCVCGADGMCTDTCPDLRRDPDCPTDCVPNGVCSDKPCPRPDVDCGNFSGGCSKPQDCLAGRCVTDPQHPQPYCSASCTPAGGCPAQMECDATLTCRYKQLPRVNKGALCIPGEQVCEAGAICLAQAGSAHVCMAMCSSDAECGEGACCAGEPGTKFCQAPKTIPFARLEGPAVPKGCSSIPGNLGVWLGLLALKLLRGQRAGRVIALRTAARGASS